MARPHTSRLIAWAGLIALLGGTSGLQAQQVYRIVGPDGRIIFSDQPPAAGKSKTLTPGGNDAGTGTNAPLPYELRQAAGRYPVTLYTGSDCSPCGSARSYLTQRGIPFSEKTVTTKEDAAALTRLSGSSDLPVLTIGGQQLKGYSNSEWAQYLDAAGYPKSSQLPAGYRPTSTPLAMPQRPNEAPAAKAAPRPPAADTPAATTSNPAGIRF